MHVVEAPWVWLFFAHRLRCPLAIGSVPCIHPEQNVAGVVAETEASARLRSTRVLPFRLRWQPIDICFVQVSRFTLFLTQPETEIPRPLPTDLSHWPHPVVLCPCRDEHRNFPLGG